MSSYTDLQTALGGPVSAELCSTVHHVALGAPRGALPRTQKVPYPLWHSYPPRYQPIGGISLSAYTAIRPRARWRWSILRKMPLGISFTRSPNRGLTARPALTSFLSRFG